MNFSLHRLSKAFEMRDIGAHVFGVSERLGQNCRDVRSSRGGESLMLLSEQQLVQPVSSVLIHPRKTPLHPVSIWPVMNLFFSYGFYICLQNKNRPNFLFFYFISAWFVISGVQLAVSIINPYLEIPLKGGTWKGKGRDHGNLLAHDGLKERLLVPRSLLYSLLMKHLDQGRQKTNLGVCVCACFCFL